MRRVVRGIVHALPLDARGRRAMDETLADWAHESTLATGALGRAVSALGALFAVVRTLLLLTVHETSRIPISWAVRRFLPIVVISSFALTMKTSASVLSTGLWHSHPGLLGWLALMLAPVALPWACLVAIATTPRGRSLPLLGLAAIAVAVSVVLNGWIGPDSSQQFRQSVYQILTGAPMGHELTRGLQELRPHALVELAFAGSSRGATNILLLRISLILACPMLVLLAARLRRTSWWIRALALGSFPVALVAGMNGPLDIKWAIVLAFLGSLALTWRVPDRSEPSASAH